MTDTTRDLIQQLAHELYRYECLTSRRPPDYIPAPSPLVAEAHAFLSQPEPEGLTDEALLAIAAASIDGYQDSGITVGEYEAEAEGVVYSYGSDLIVFARAVIAADRARWGCPAIEPETNGQT